LNSVQDLPKPREIEEILKDDDMAEHRQLLMSRQLMLEAEEEGRVELKGDIYGGLAEEMPEKAPEETDITAVEDSRETTIELEETAQIEDVESQKDSPSGESNDAAKEDN